MARVKIDITNGTLEVEGEEKFVERVYTDFKDKLVKDFGEFKGDTVEIVAKRKPGKKPGETPAKKKKATKRKESYNIVSDLDLYGKGGKKSLKDFYSEKAPKTNMERNTVFVYYLQKELNLTGITVEHVYTCYKHVSTSVPRALVQSLLDTSSRNGWLNTKSTNDISITTQGENLIEQELPRKKV